MMTDNLNNDKIIRTGRVLIIGIGNDFRGDDSIGLVIARNLKRQSFKNCIIIESTGDGGSLMNSWKAEDKVIIIDAVSSNSPPGTIHRFNAIEKPLPADIFGRISSHSFGIIEAIEIARTLGKMPSRLIVYGIEGMSFDEGAGLSTEINAVIPKVKSEIISEVDLF